MPNCQEILLRLSQKQLILTKDLNSFDRCATAQENKHSAKKNTSRHLYFIRGLLRNFDLRVPFLSKSSTFEWVPLRNSQNFTGSAEPVEPVLTWPL